MTAAVIGGGIAGLVAAYELTKLGERPYLIEPRKIGGVISSISADGYTLELGPNILVERPEIKDLVEALDLTDSVVYPRVKNYGQYVWYNDKATKAPRGLVELMSNPLMSATSKCLLPLRLFLPGVLNTKSADCSVEDFFTPLIGTHALHAMVDPVLKGIYGGDVARLSARSLFPNLWASAKRSKSVMSFLLSRDRKGKPPVFVLKGGIEKLVQGLWAEIQPHVEHVSEPVKRIFPLNEARYSVLLESGRRLEVDGCLLATGGRALKEIMPALSETLSERLEALRFADLSVMHFAVPKSANIIPDAFGVLFPGGQPHHLLGVMFNSMLFPHVAPANRHVLTVVLGGAQAENQPSDKEMLQREVPTLLNRLLGIKGADFLLYTHWSNAIPQLEVGHHTIVDAMDVCESEWPGIVFSGVERGGVGVSDRIRVAHEAVHRFRRSRVETVV